MILPAAYQPPLPLNRLMLPVGAPGAGDRMELDVLIVGAGPAGLACAIELAGARTGATGVDSGDQAHSNYADTNDVVAQITALAKATGVSLSLAWLERQAVTCENPQNVALGIKEICETTRSPVTIVHTLAC